MSEAGGKGYRELPHEQVLRELGTDPARGLPEEEVDRRLVEYGRNEVPEKTVNPAQRIGQKFWGVTAWMLELTMVFSFLLHNYFDVYIIGALLVVNAAVGFLQEQRASSALEELRQKLRVSARVLRGGTWRTVPSSELVPGDVVRVRAGDLVPADLKITEETDIEADESSLTGESMAAEKGVDGVLFSGTSVKRGEANTVVVATGRKTYFGRTAELLQVARPRLHMEEVTSSVVRWLLVMVGLLVGLMLAVSYADGIGLLVVMPLALVLLVNAVPVALPTMFTVSMAVGSTELAWRGVLVTRLSASEDAASMDVLCADKTGTITANKLSVSGVASVEGFSGGDVVRNGALASREANQDPIDLAIISAAVEKGLLDGRYLQKEFVPFDPKTRKTEALIESDSGDFRVMKGAVETVAEACGVRPGETGMEGKISEFAARGYRTLAVATSSAGFPWRLCGLVALQDAPRPDSTELIGKLTDLGVSVKMLTGDALPIAREIARQVGLGGSVLSASEFRNEVEKHPSGAARLAEGSSGFAEIYPEDKYAIVKALQAAGHVTGMTGDGVNDAPALRQAEVGIAVSTAADVAKGAASAVLTQEGLSNIVALVEVGRMIYQRVVTWTLNKVVKTFQVAVFVSLAFLLTGYYVVSSLDVVLLLFAVDFVTVSLSTDSVRWSRSPERWNVKGLVAVGVLLGCFTVAELFGLLLVGLRYLGLSRETGTLHTFIFAAIFYLGIFTVIIVRERGRFWASAPSRTLALAMSLDTAVVAVLVTVGIPGVAPIPPADLALAVAYVSVLSLTVNDLAKFFLMKRFGVTNDR